MASQHDGFRLRLLECLAQWQDALAKALLSCFASYDKPVKPSGKNLKTVGLIDLQALSESLACAFWVNWQGALLHSQLARSALALQAVVQQLQQHVMDVVLQLRRQQVDADAASAQSTLALPKVVKVKPQASKPDNSAKPGNKIQTAKPVKKSSKIKALQVSLDF